MGNDLIKIARLLLIHIALIHTSDYTCTPGQDCVVTFNTYQSAYQSTLTCPTNHKCQITCTDPTVSDRTDSYQTCQELTIIAYASTTVTIHCNGLKNCKQMKFIGSTSNTGNVTVNCADTNACHMAEFNFKSSQYVTINCDSEDSCNSALFDGTLTHEMYLNFNALNSGDYATIHCGSICAMYVIDTQSNLNIYSYNILFGDVLRCNSNEDNCFVDSKIICDNNYTQPCDISFTDDTYICDQCLNYIFTDYELEISMEYRTAQLDTVQYRQRMQYAFSRSVIHLLTDPTDQFMEPIEIDCDCIADIDEHISILITDQFMGSPSYSMNILVSTDLSVILQQITEIFSDGRFQYLLTAKIGEFDESFEVLDIQLPETPTKSSKKDEQIIGWITIVIVCILGIVLIIAVIGTIQMYKYDVTIYVTGILLFGLYTWDFYSDILFSYEVYISYALAIDEENVFLGLFLACLVFLILPIIASIASLFRFQDKWKNDQSIGDRVIGWNRDWSTYLLILTILSGSSFAAVNILNSRVFGHPLFCMGLSYRHLKKFENQRLWGVIISENIPQLIIQGIYFWKSSQTFSSILVLAFVSSLLSIIVALIDIYNNKRLFGQFSNNDDYQTILKVPVISHEVAGKQWRLALATHRFNEVFSKIIGVDKYAIEVDLPLPNQNGLVINFSVRTVDISPKDIVDAMTRAQRNGAMAKFIQEAWNLEKQPLLGRLKFDQVGRKQTEMVTDTAIEMVNPLNSDGKKLAEEDAVTTLTYAHKNKGKRQRTNTVEAKPYDDLGVVAKSKIKKEKKKRKTNSTVPAGARKMRVESESSYAGAMNRSANNIEIMGQINENETEKAETVSDVPKNIANAQIKLKSVSQSESSLPRQPTGAHTKQMRDLGANFIESSNKITKKEIESPVSPTGKHVQNNPQIQFQQQIQYNGPSQNYSQSSVNLNNSAHNMSYNNANAPQHRTVQTYSNMPYNNQQINQLPYNGTNMRQQNSYSQSQTNMQSQFQAQVQSNYNNYGGYAQSAIDLDQNNYGNMQSNYQNPQMYAESSADFNNISHERTESEHIGFVPPTPDQEVNKYMNYKQKRMMRDEEKKLRKQKEREQKRMQNTMNVHPNLSKIESMNEMGANGGQLGNNNNNGLYQNNNGQYQNNNYGNGNNIQMQNQQNRNQF